MISVDEMNEIEDKANEIGIDDSIMMENAGKNACKAADRKYKLKGKKVLVFCGTGNMGRLYSQ